MKRRRRFRRKVTLMTRARHGLHIKFLPVNRAYAVMWHGSVLSIKNTKSEAESAVLHLLRGGSGV